MNTESKLEKALAALRWYAQANYEKTVCDKLGYFDSSEWMYDDSEVELDRGQRARDALAEIEQPKT